MFCNQCHKNLKDFEALLDKMENCPFCGAKLVRPPVKVPQKDVNTLFDDLVKKIGENIFVDDSTLETELRNLSAPEFEDAKDRLFLLVLKHIPSSMYAVKDFSDGEQQEKLEACLRRLCVDLGMSFEPSAQMLDALQGYIWKKTFPLSPNFFEGHFVDPRDGQVYKTVKIGDLELSLQHTDSLLNSRILTFHDFPVCVTNSEAMLEHIVAGDDVPTPVNVIKVRMG